LYQDRGICDSSSKYLVAVMVSPFGLDWVE